MRHKENGLSSGASILVRCVLFTAMIISLCVWAVIGFIIYIPMLLRMTAYYCSMVFASAFNPVDLKAVQQRLEYAAHMYPDRFKMIIQSFENPSSEIPPANNITPIGWREFFKKSLVDLLWTIIFWASSIFYFIKT